MTTLYKIHPAGKMSAFIVIYADTLPAAWILRSAVNFSHFIPLDKGHMPENMWKLSFTNFV